MALWIALVLRNFVAASLYRPEKVVIVLELKGDLTLTDVAQIVSEGPGDAPSIVHFSSKSSVLTALGLQTPHLPSPPRPSFSPLLPPLPTTLSGIAFVPLCHSVTLCLG